MKRIESAQNAYMKHWKKLNATRKERTKSGEYIIEGFHLVEEALKTKDVIQMLIVADSVDLPRTWDTEDIPMIEITDVLAKELAETEHTQGIFAVCAIPSHDSTNSFNKVLLIDAVQDPGNIGTMIRTALAAGIDAVILGKGSADLYSPKTLRSAQGAHFHLPVIQGDLQPWLEQLIENNIPIYGTSLQNAVPFQSISPTPSFALMVGNEGNGIDSTYLTQTTKNIIIPMNPAAESLNVAVATGILLFHFSQIHS